MSITEQIVVEGANPAELNAALAVKIGLGYQPFGQPYTRQSDQHPIRYLIGQAMVMGAPVSQDPTNLQSAIDTVAARALALESTINTAVTGLSAVVAGHTTTIASHTGTLASHTSELANHESRIAALEAP